MSATLRLRHGGRVVLGNEPLPIELLVDERVARAHIADFAGLRRRQLEGVYAAVDRHSRRHLPNDALVDGAVRLELEEG